MLRITLLPILLLISFTHNAWAQTSCPQVVPKVFKRIFQEESGLSYLFAAEKDEYVDNELITAEEKLFDYFTPSLSNVSCSQFIKFGKLINNVKNKFGKYLIYPKNLSVNLVQSHDTASSYQGVISVPMSLFVPNYFASGKLSNLYKHPKYTHPIWIHEYAHGIFNEMMKKASSSWNKMSLLLHKQNNVMINFTRKHHPLLRSCRKRYLALKKQGVSIQKMKSKLAAQCTNPINKLRVQADKLFDQYEAPISRYTTLRETGSIYNEFFSDIIAVLTLNNGSAMYEALHRSGHRDIDQPFKHRKSPHKSLSRARDFTYYKNDLDYFLDRVPASHVATGPHNMLSAVRRHVWKYYLSNPIYKGKMGWVTQEVFKAVSSEVIKLTSILRKKPRLKALLLPEVFDDTPVSLSDKKTIKKTIYIINESLIKLIDQRFEK